MPYLLRYPPGYDFILDSDPVWIGNDPNDTIILNDFAALPHQIVIELNEQGYYITNLGTFGMLVSGYELTPGSSIQLEACYNIHIGQSVITYLWEEDSFFEAISRFFRRLAWRLRTLSN